MMFGVFFIGAALALLTAAALLILICAAALSTHIELSCAVQKYENRLELHYIIKGRKCQY